MAECCLSSGELRLIDANLNRLKEGVRVVEDICRFILDDSELTKSLKEIRHCAKISILLDALTHRDIIGDCSKSTTKSESSRADINSIIIANFKRAQESSRVLEELLKLYNRAEADNFKTIRYRLYDVEKKLFLKIICTVN